MWTYILRWQVINCLYQLQQRRDHRVWIQEHDLCAFIAGTDLERHRGGDTWFTLLRARLSCILFGATDVEDLYRCIRNVIHECVDEEVHWIKTTKGDNGISDYLILTTRGREVYGYIHWLQLFLDNFYVRWAIPIIVLYVLAHNFNIVVQPK